MAIKPGSFHHPTSKSRQKFNHDPKLFSERCVHEEGVVPDCASLGDFDLLEKAETPNIRELINSLIITTTVPAITTTIDPECLTNYTYNISSTTTEFTEFSPEIKLEELLTTEGNLVVPDMIEVEAVDVEVPATKLPKMADDFEHQPAYDSQTANLTLKKLETEMIDQSGQKCERCLLFIFIAGMLFLLMTTISYYFMRRSHVSRANY